MQAIMASSKFSIFLQIVLMAIFFGLSPLVPPPVMATGLETAVVAETGNDSKESYQTIITLLQEQEQKNSRELRQIKREIAALGQQLDNPGFAEIIGGIGYILGLFGIAAYVASRKRKGAGEG